MWYKEAKDGSMKEIIGRRIKEERQRQNLTQEELIKHSQLTWDRQTLGNVEKGEREVKAWELASIAKALGVGISSFFPSSPSIPDPVVLWREQPPNFRKMEADFLRMCKDYQMVESFGESATAEFRQLPNIEIDLKKFTYNDAYALAERIRQNLDFGEYPASNLVKVLEEKFGVKFFFNDLDGNVSAACSVSSYGNCILISANEAPWRQHFSIAHELFHTITWSESLITLVGEDETMWKKNESLANAFAAGLLVPSEALRAEIRKFSKNGNLNDAGIVAIARQFAVSLEALIWRMVGLGIISRDTGLEALNDEGLKSTDFISRSETQHPTYLSNRFVRLAYVAYENDEISKARLAKMLGCTLSDLKQYLSQFGLSEVSNNEFPLSYS
jgi:XRE family transcriptional regulator, fatty acid utilization regulator